MALPKPVKITHLTAPRQPLWKGPSAAGPNGGVTQSMISAFVQCRERFRLRYVEGLRAAERFSARMEYGNMWHACEESFALHGNDHGAASMWRKALGDYCTALGYRYPVDREEIVKWGTVCLTQFPRYIDYWAKNDDVQNRTPLLTEQVFDVPYRLPSGRTVRLRGKWDSVDLVGTGKAAGVWLQENKTKARIDENVLRRQLTFDLQTCLYLVALGMYQGPKWTRKTTPVVGVRYNVIRRTEHRQGKKETVADFCNRVGGLIEESPGDWFMRWNVEVGPADLAAFRRKCLDPLLDDLCDWYAYVTAPDDNKPTTRTNYSCHWQTPFGVGTWLLDGGSSDYDQYLETGSETGLRRTEELFTELQ